MDNQGVSFLRQFNLPDALFSVSAGNDVPNELWMKIDNFQKTGTSSNVNGMLDQCKQLKATNEKLILDVEAALKAEQELDDKNR
mmetsp:Transcript_20890/g.28879  ORF Transcript_20890/g.28879 Transcript_20890/m.28879 type:complete len:84 (-) Transcript_20890:1472-1723(-)